MADRKSASVIYTKYLSPMLQVVRIQPEEGSEFPLYSSGQFIALSRDNCKLTKRVLDEYGQKSYVYDLDETGNPKIGTVTHSYSIASSPYETVQYGYLEFYIALESITNGLQGRLTESLFTIEPGSEEKIHYFNKIAGNFTLQERIDGYKHVLMVGTGTGLAPFASMIKQLHFETSKGIRHNIAVTLLHTNRTVPELGYHTELQAIEAAKKLDFLYIPTISRPEESTKEENIGIGRANNVLRLLFDLSMKEEQDLELSKQQGDSSKAEVLLKRMVKPELPAHLSKSSLLGRLDPKSTIILTCGNPLLMEDVKYIAEQKSIRFEKEDW